MEKINPGRRAYLFFLLHFSWIEFHSSLFISGIFLGPEFPSIIGGLVGLAVVTFAIKKNFLIPKDSWNFPSSSNWPISWKGSIEMPLGKTQNKISTLNAWFPYIFSFNTYNFTNL